MSEQLKWINAALNEDIVPHRKGATEFTIPDTVDELIFMAKVTEQAERYDEMVLCMRKVVKINSDLQTEERNLLSVAYKNVVGSRRNAWRIITSIEARENEKGSHENLPVISALRKEFEFELAAICEDLLNLLDVYLIPASPNGESKVFYLKMKGDYHRYYAETSSGNTQKQLALEAYDKALKAAITSLPPTNPVRLGLVLNFSVFYYEIMKQYETGFRLAREAFDEAMSELETLDDDAFREANLIVQLLRDNLNLWNDEQQFQTQH